jgi:ribosomal protein L17
MALSMQRLSGKPLGPVASRVSWGLSRGETFAQVRVATLKKVKGATIKAIKSAVELFRRKTRAAGLLARAGKKQLIHAANLPGGRERSKVMRVTVDIDVRMGDDSDFRTGRFIYDVPTGLTRDQIITDIYNQLIRDMAERYLERKGGIRAIDKRIGGISVVAMESF